MRLVGSELFKLRTTRTFYGLIGGALALLLVIVIPVSAFVHFHHGDAPLRSLLRFADLVRAFALVLGILSITSEFRHGTITPSLLVVPDRTKLVLAKLGASILSGLVMGFAAFGLTTLIVKGFASARGFDAEASGADVIKMIVGGTISTALIAALGLGLGAIVRNQVGAIIGALVYSFLLEGLLGLIPGIDKVLPKYGLAGTGLGLGHLAGHGDDVPSQLTSGLLLALYAAVFVVAGIVVMRRRDISA